MMRTPDAYLRERMHDLDDLSNRLMRILTGAVATASRSDLPANAIIVSRNMGPAELLDYDRRSMGHPRRGRQDQRSVVAGHSIPPCEPRAQPTSWTGGSIVIDGNTVNCCQAIAGFAEILCGEGAVLCAQAGAVCGAARCAGGHQGWREDQSQYQCGVDCRLAAPA
jgi:hypothetical protein